MIEPNAGASALEDMVNEVCPMTVEAFQEGKKG